MLVSMKDVAVIEFVAPQRAYAFNVPRLIEGRKQPLSALGFCRARRFGSVVYWGNGHFDSGSRLEGNAGHDDLALFFHRGECFVGFHSANSWEDRNHFPPIVS